MVEKMKSVKLDVTLGALITVALGIILIIWPTQTASVLARLIAAAIIAIGVVIVIFELTSVPVSIFGTGAGALITIIGLWFFIQPTILTNFIPIVIGIWLVIHGIRDMMMAFEGRRYKAGSWLAMGLVSIVSIIFGVICICSAFDVVKVTMVIFGVMLIIDGVTDMLVVRKVNKAAKAFADMESMNPANAGVEVIDATDDVKPIDDGKTAGDGKTAEDGKPDDTDAE